MLRNDYIMADEHHAAFVGLSEGVVPWLHASWRFDLRNRRCKGMPSVLADGQPEPKPSQAMPSL